MRLEEGGEWAMAMRADGNQYTRETRRVYIFYHLQPIAQGRFPIGN